MSSAGQASASAKSNPAIGRQRDKATPFLILLIMLLLAGAVIIYAYPWQLLVLRLGEQGVPKEPLNEQAVAAGAASWCVDLAPDDESSLLSAAMHDDGTAGDRVAGDGIFSMRQAFSETGIHYWRVVACDNPTLAFPSAPSWLWVEEANQNITLTFDTNNYKDAGSDPFFPAANIVDADDPARPLYVYGTINDWREADDRTRMRWLGNRQYRLVYKLNNRKPQEVAVTIVDEEGELHGYMADGRSQSSNMVQFQPQRDNDTIVVELDRAAGRLNVIYDMPAFFVWLAYERGYLILPLGILLASIPLTLLVLKRYQTVRRADLHPEAGCPACGNVTLTRIPRTSGMRLAQITGISTANYRCRTCTWQGMRLAGGNVPQTRNWLMPLRTWSGLLLLILLLALTIVSSLRLRAELRDVPPVVENVNALLVNSRDSFDSTTETLGPLSSIIRSRLRGRLIGMSDSARDLADTQDAQVALLDLMTSIKSRAAELLNWLEQQGY